MTVLPHARVHIMVSVGHHSFAMTLSVFPVAIIITNTKIGLLSDTVLLILKPRPRINISGKFRIVFFVSVGSLARPQLKAVIDLGLYLRHSGSPP